MPPPERSGAVSGAAAGAGKGEAGSYAGPPGWEDGIDKSSTCGLSGQELLLPRSHQHPGQRPPGLV